VSRVAARIALIGLIAAIVGSLVIVPALAATVKVTGTLILPADVAGPGPDAIAIVTLIDSTDTTDAGNIIGEQRIDGIGTAPISFAVPFEGDTIDKTHSYALFATVVDGESVWQNATGVPVITGGPIEAVKVAISPTIAGSAVITGTMPLPGGTVLGPAAVAIAALVKQETGTLVSRQVVPTVSGSPPAFAISIDPSLLDPAATYVVKAAVVDGGTVWENGTGVVAIANGATTGVVTVPLTLTTATIPVSSPFPTAIPSTKPTASTKPSPTTKPTPTAVPSATATASATATPAPTASPTPTPSATPTPAATASPTPTPMASPVPPTGVLTGTLTYPEPHTLTAGATAAIALVAGKGKVTSTSIVSTQSISPAGQVPIAFKITYDPAQIDPSAVYTVQAGVFDGDVAWVTSKGIPVITNGVQADVAITLAYRPDVAKGEVTGSVTGVGIDLGTDATSMAVLIDVDSGLSLGVDLTRPTTLPAPFAIPFAVSDLKSDGTYVVQAEVTAGDQTWANAAGVPVITGGNPLSGVQVVVNEVAKPTPSPSPTPVPTPTASPPPTADTGLDGGTLLLPLIILGALIAVGGFLLARSKDDEPPPPPSGSQADPDVIVTGASDVAAVPEPAGAPLAPDEAAALMEPPSAIPQAAIDPPTAPPKVDP
jgi:uncharacterized lipoprotein YbaY